MVGRRNGPIRDQVSSSLAVDFGGLHSGRVVSTVASCLNLKQACSVQSAYMHVKNTGLAELCEGVLQVEDTARLEQCGEPHALGELSKYELEDL